MTMTLAVPKILILALLLVFTMGHRYLMVNIWLINAIASIALEKCIYMTKSCYRPFLLLNLCQKNIFSVGSIVFGEVYFSTHHSFSVLSFYNPFNIPDFLMPYVLCVQATITFMIPWTLAVQFIYRYVALKHPSSLEYLYGGKRWLLWLLGLFVIAIGFAENMYCFGPMMENGDSGEFEDEIREVLEMNKTSTLNFVRFKLYEEVENGNWRFDKGMIGFSIMNLFNLIPLVIIVVLGFKIYFGLKAKAKTDTADLTDDVKKQKYLFKALVVQTLTMIIFLYIPIFTNLILSIFHKESGILCTIGVLAFALYPVVDHTLVIIAIDPFYKHVKDVLNNRYPKSPRVYPGPSIDSDREMSTVRKSEA